MTTSLTSSFPVIDSHSETLPSLRIDKPFPALLDHAHKLDFDAMDEFMTHVLEAIRVNGSLAVRVFPPASEVLLNFADRLATDVVC